MARSVDRAIALLEAFVGGERELGLTELARKTGIDKASAYRALVTLASHGYVVQDPQSSKYSLGLRCWDLGRSALAGRSLQVVAPPILTHLVSETGESAHVAVYSNRGVAYTNLVESPQPMRATTRIGDYAPAHCVATGKVMLAERGDEAVEKYLSGDLQQVTPYTITDPKRLRLELKQIRLRGYAVTHGEWRPDICGLAAPVRDHNGHTIAAIGISCPMSRFDASAIAPKVLTAAREASTQLGFRDADPPVFRLRPAEDEQSRSVGSHRRRARQHARRMSHG